MARVTVEVPIEDEDHDQQPSEVATNQNQVVNTETAEQTPAANQPVNSNENTNQQGAQAQPPANVPKSAFGSKQIAIAAMFVVLVGAVAFLLQDRKDLQSQASATPAETEEVATTENEAELLTQEISEFYQVPEGEFPTVATVVDAEKVKDQSFFRNAQNDDKVLLFSEAGTAILYRPSEKKIIEVAPIDLGDSTQESVDPDASTDQ